MTEKDQKIIEDSKKTGEPIFVLRAKDDMALMSLSVYYKNCRQQGCSEEFLDELLLRIEEFRTFKAINKHLIKLPD